MRKAVVILLCLVLSFIASAQIPQRPHVPTRKEVMAENSKMHSQLDSLKAALDSVKRQQYLDEQKYMAMVEGNEKAAEGMEPRQYSPELTDSLLHLWYKHNFAKDLDERMDYDMDAIHFTSSVSDQVLMQRLASINPYFSVPFNDVVRNYMILYAEKMPERMGRVLGVSHYYFPIFEETFLKYGLPQELKYMAVAESMLRPTATSRAGAKGIWQFMYKTAKAYGLRIDSYVDERMDVNKAADAAARYMRDSYRIFGDWILVICSYNCGAGNVTKAIKRAGDKADFWSIYPYLPKETRGYVPSFIGAMYALSHWKDLGIKPTDVGMPAKTDTFEVHKNLTFKQISEVVGVPMMDLENLNPQYYNGIIPGNGGTCVLNVPSKWTTAYAATSPDSLYTHNPSVYTEDKPLKEKETSTGTTATEGRIVYKVRSGDSLSKIASHHHVTVKQLRAWNNLHSDRLHIGQTIYINGGK